MFWEKKRNLLPESMSRGANVKYKHANLLCSVISSTSPEDQRMKYTDPRAQKYNYKFHANICFI